MRVKASLKQADAKFLFYNTKTVLNGVEFDLLKDEDYDPSCMERIEEPGVIKEPVKKRPKKSKKKEAIEDDSELDLGEHNESFEL